MFSTDFIFRQQEHLVILLTTKNVRLDSGCYATKYYFKSGGWGGKTIDCPFLFLLPPWNTRGEIKRTFLAATIVVSIKVSVYDLTIV